MYSIEKVRAQKYQIEEYRDMKNVRQNLEKKSITLAPNHPCASNAPICAMCAPSYMMQTKLHCCVHLECACVSGSHRRTSAPPSRTMGKRVQYVVWVVQVPS